VTSARPSCTTTGTAFDPVPTHRRGEETAGSPLGSQLWDTLRDNPSWIAASSPRMSTVDRRHGRPRARHRRRPSAITARHLAPC
jgi:hypothetical protein